MNLHCPWCGYALKEVTYDVNCCEHDEEMVVCCFNKQCVADGWLMRPVMIEEIERKLR